MNHDGGQHKPVNGIYSIDMDMETCDVCGDIIQARIGWDEKNKRWLCGDCVERAIV